MHPLNFPSLADIAALIAALAALIRALRGR